MSKIAIPFHIEGHPEFRFSLTLESNSVEAHSLLDSGDNKERIKSILDSARRYDRLSDLLEELVKKWKEEKR